MKIINFVRNNWKFLASALLATIGIILFSSKKQETISYNGGVIQRDSTGIFSFTHQSESKLTKALNNFQKNLEQLIAENSGENSGKLSELLKDEYSFNDVCISEIMTKFDNNGEFIKGDTEADTKEKRKQALGEGKTLWNAYIADKIVQKIKKSIPQ